MRRQGGIDATIWLQHAWRNRVPEPSLLRTHPETRERIARLSALKPELAREGVLSLDTAAFDARPAFGQPIVRPPRWHVSGVWH